MSDPSKGEQYKVSYPFVRCTVDVFEEDGVVKIKSWRPGVDYETTQYTEICFANGIGEMILEVVDVHKPGKYPTRVFYTRKWKSPEGIVFGKSSLRITSLQNFKNLIKGYRHEYELVITNEEGKS